MSSENHLSLDSNDRRQGIDSTVHSRPTSIRGLDILSEAEHGGESAISYATSLAKLNPFTGLFSASIPAVMYSFLGTSRQLNVACEAALSLLVGQAVQNIIFHPDSTNSFRYFTEPEQQKLAIAVGTIITFQAGLMTFLLGIFRLGFIDVILSRALLRGFVTALAFVILLEQLIPIFGLSALEAQGDPPQTTLDKLLFLTKYVIIQDRAHWLTARIGFGALAALIIFRAVKRRVAKRYDWVKWIPEVLLAVIAFTGVIAVISSKLGWETEGVAILGRVKLDDVPLFAFPLHGLNINLFKRTASTAILISIVGFLDSIAAAKQNAVRFGYSISPNRELVALGDFSVHLSRLNADCGGRTQMASIIASAIILLATFFLLPSLYHLPKSVLSAVVCLVVWSLLAEAPHEFMWYYRMGAWMELGLMGLTLILTIIWSVEVGVLASIAISVLLVVKKSSQARMSILGRIPGTDQWKPISENPEAVEPLSGVLIVRIRESLNFANSAQMKERLRRLELYGIEPKHPSEAPTRQNVNVLVFHLADMETCDSAAVQVFSELVDEYKRRGVHIYFTHLRGHARLTLDKAGVLDALGEDSIFENVTSAMQHIEILELGGH
ncbi:hypothetical protein Clacol_002618 [Clathrus columnatus]|uniref:STAS domain-containing protein n=1 Tax=Clathrus columnatus TaxID=1419009 RepID=A0AAV5A196_9AGAM|nr:hypothetical protein Clacol_002618 [Clathrus columnatus]